MATADEVKKLATLARISVEDAELEKFTKEFDSILSYVGQLETLELPKDLSGEKSPLRNVMRDDGDPTPAGTYTEKIVEQFPTREDNALVVKQIIQND